MKRIDVILKGKCSKIAGLFQRKSARLLRNVDQAIAYAEDQVDIAKGKKNSILESLGDVADADQTAECSATINDYVEVVGQIKEWEETVEALKGLKAELNEEVELEPEEDE